MPVRRKTRKRATVEPTWDQILELVCGPRPTGSSFGDDAERQAAWSLCRARELAGHRAGSRPWAWWLYDSPEPRDSAVHETLQLLGFGLLDDAEIEALTPRWRHAETVGRVRHDVEYWRAWGGVPNWFIDGKDTRVEGRAT